VLRGRRALRQSLLPPVLPHGGSIVERVPPHGGRRAARRVPGM
jgi:hypothetical protein